MIISASLEVSGDFMVKEWRGVPGVESWISSALGGEERDRLRGSEGLTVKDHGLRS